MQKLQTLDYLVFLFYFIIVAGYGYWIYNKKKSENALDSASEKAKKLVEDVE